MTTRPIAILLLAACGLAAACMPPPVYEVHRAALVQPPSPPMWSGRTKPTGFTMGNSSVVWKDCPERSSGSESGLFVSGTQFDGNLHIDLGPSGTVSLWIPLSYGLEHGAFAAAPGLTERPDHGTLSGGVGVGLTFPLGDLFYLGTSIETQLALIPTRVVAHCVENCTYAQDSNKVDSELVPVLRWSLAGGVDFDFIRIFAGIGLRNHPSNVQISYDVTYCPECIDGEVEFGPIYGLAGLGVEVDVCDILTILAQIYQPFPLYQDDLIYGPIAGVAVDLHMARPGR
ncbi:MAG: hypothetical protein JXR96_06445 [Deltaproteobacteria bacterium]|nr:hypothetical protein [Deltaproteobacteria bacterium]